MPKENNELRRSLGFGSAISIVIGTIIGSEIFFKQASILDSAGSSTMAIAAWIFGGVITLTAGLTIAKIGAQMPYTGGFMSVKNLYGRSQLVGCRLLFIVYAMARRGDLPFSHLLSYVTPKGKAPIIATIFIIILATIMMLFFDPDHLSDLCVFTIYCFYLMTFFGIFILRKKNK